MSGLARGIADTATDTANTETAKRMIRMQRYSADEIASVSTLEKHVFSIFQTGIILRFTSASNIEP